MTGKRVLDDVERYTGSTVPHPEASAAPTSFVVTDQGDVAWIAGHAAGDPLVDVRYAARGRAVRLLDFAPDIVPDSLALGERFVYWQRGQTAQVAGR